MKDKLYYALCTIKTFLVGNASGRKYCPGNPFTLSNSTANSNQPFYYVFNTSNSVVN